MGATGGIAHESGASPQHICSLAYSLIVLNYHKLACVVGEYIYNPEYLEDKICFTTKKSMDSL
jgi:hypothetical protein